MFRHALSRRDAFLLLLGASSMHIWSLLMSSSDVDITSDYEPLSSSSYSSGLSTAAHEYIRTVTTTQTSTATITHKQTETQTQSTTSPLSTDSWSYAELDRLAGLESLNERADDPVPQSGLIAHAPGWTIFRNLYMTNDTLYIVTDKKPVTPSVNDPDNSREKRPYYYGPGGQDMTYGFTSAEGWPELRRMTSTGLSAVADPQSEMQREPTTRNMQFITPEEARRRWGDVLVKDSTSGKERKESRVWVVQGNTLLFNDPSQFLRHYYHFVAELFFGVQAFWNSAFSPSSTLTSDPSLHFSTEQPKTIPPIHRAIFIHSNADGWRDNPGFNRYFLRAAFPSLTVEHEEDWQDRVAASIEGVHPHPRAPPGSGTLSSERVWRFPLVLLTDRSAAHRGQVCGSQTQRTAAEAWEAMRKEGKLRGIHVGGWWAPVREAIWKFAGVEYERSEKMLGDAAQAAFLRAVDGGGGGGAQKVRGHGHGQHKMRVGVVPAETKKAASESPVVVDVNHEAQNQLPMPKEIVITYISRQSARNRKLVKEDHDLLVESMTQLVRRKNEEKEIAETNGHGQTSPNGVLLPSWSFNVLEAEHLTKDEQVQAAARTTILLGVHGNGLTHLVWMKPTRVSSVIEIFCPPGFAHDYWWTARSLGMRHWAVWNDTVRTWPDKPDVAYPECFQKNAIPVHGPTVAKLVEDRIEGKL